MSAWELEVIVLDDRSRFALHVWRYLSRSVGFGIGRVPLSGEMDASSDKPRWPLETPAGDARVQWVNIGSSRPESVWKAELQQTIVATEKAKHRVFLVDVRGDGLGVEEEFWPFACDELERCGVALSSDSIWLVSSYGVGSRQCESIQGGNGVRWTIRPKSVETLQELARVIWPEGSLGSRLSRGVARPGTAGKSELHILITGAGFEITRSNWSEINPLGVPSTKKILESAFSHQPWPQERDKPLTKSAYPCPSIDSDAARVASAECDLDKLWNELLKWILARKSPEVERFSGPGDKRPLAKAKAEMLEEERQARETFRSAFLKFDWGLLTQALDAASLPWDVWMTTNYTQFVDRAVALLNSVHKTEEEDLPPWRILSVALEAELLIRQMFFIGEHSKPLGDRYVFKLHGDLGHLSTMAIAGSDKELFSPFTHSVSSLHWMYEAAGRWVERLIRLSKKGCRVNWHIVGHGLRDEVLVQTIQNIVDTTKQCEVENIFHFVQPLAQVLLDTDETVKAAKESLGSLEPRIYGADAWMAMLAKFYRKNGRMLDPLTDL